MNKRAMARIAKEGGRLRRIDTHDEVFPVNADRHVPAQQEGDAAEHLLLNDPRSTRELLPDSRGLRLRVGHRSREALSAHESWRRLPGQPEIAGNFRTNSPLVS